MRKENEIQWTTEKMVSAVATYLRGLDPEFTNLQVEEGEGGTMTVWKEDESWTDDVKYLTFIPRTWGDLNTGERQLVLEILGFPYVGEGRHLEYVEASW